MFAVRRLLAQQGKIQTNVSCLKLASVSLGSRLRCYSGAQPGEAKKEEYFQFREQKIPYVHELAIPDPSGDGPMPCFRVLDETGKRIKDTDQYDMEETMAKDIYKPAKHTHSLAVARGTRASVAHKKNLLLVELHQDQE